MQRRERLDSLLNYYIPNGVMDSAEFLGPRLGPPPDPALTGRLDLLSVRWDGEKLGQLQAGEDEEN